MSAVPNCRPVEGPHLLIHGSISDSVPFGEFPTDNEGVLSGASFKRLTTTVVIVVNRN